MSFNLQLKLNMAHRYPMVYPGRVCEKTAQVQDEKRVGQPMPSNAIATGIAATIFSGYCFGANAPMRAVSGLACAVTHIALAKINPLHDEKTWFPLNQKGFADIKANWTKSLWVLSSKLVANVVAGIALRYLSACAGQKLPPPPTTRLTLLACVVAPIVEEIVFRGFLLEKIRDVQARIWGKRADSEGHLVARCVIQAVSFGACHCSSSLPRAVNAYIFATITSMGLLHALDKESYSHLLCSVAQHFYHNVLVATRMRVFGI